MRDCPVLSCWSVKVWNASVGSHFVMSRPLVLKQWFANATFSRVQVMRSVFTRVFESTELMLVASVWSTSDSSRAAAAVTLPMIWLVCGEVSRSQRTL